MTAATWSDHQIKIYRAQTAPWNKNFWDRIYDIPQTPIGGWIILLYAIAIGGMYLGGHLLHPLVGQILSSILIGGLIVALTLFSLARERVKKAPTWISESLATMMASRFREYKTQSMLRQILEETRKSNPTAEFMVEYLFKQKERDWSMFPENLILWAYPNFGSEKRYVALVIKDGEPYEPSD